MFSFHIGSGARQYTCADRGFLKVACRGRDEDKNTATPYSWGASCITAYSLRWRLHQQTLSRVLRGVFGVMPVIPNLMKEYGMTLLGSGFGDQKRTCPGMEMYRLGPKHGWFQFENSQTYGAVPDQSDE